MGAGRECENRPVTSDEAVQVNAEGHGHACLCSDEVDGRAVQEMVPIRLVDDGTVEVLGSPGLVMGCAAGDVLKLADGDGRFIVRHRGPNECVQAYADTPFTPEAVAALSARFDQVRGIVEAPGHRKFVVVTVPTAAGEQWISRQMTEWCATVEGAEWQFGTSPDA